MALRLLPHLVKCQKGFNNRSLPRALFNLRSTAGEGYATTRLLNSSYQRSVSTTSHVHAMPYATIKESSLNDGVKKSATQTAEQLLEKLQQQFQYNGIVCHEQFDKLLKQLELHTDTFNKAFSEKDIEFLLACCSNAMPAQLTGQRMEFFQRIWAYLSKHGQLKPHHYKMHLAVLVENGAPLQDLPAFLKELFALDSNLAVSAELYTELLEVACNTGNMRQASEVLNEMKSHTIALSESNFNALILGNAHSGDMDSINKVLDSMKAADLPSTLITQTTLIVAYLICGEIAKAKDILSKHHRQFSMEQIIYILKRTLKYELDENMIKDVMNELPRDETIEMSDVPTRLRHICIQLTHQGKLSTVACIINSLPAPNYSENVNNDTFGVFLLQELFKANIDTPTIIEFAKMLRDTKKNPRALHIACEIALRRNPPHSLPILKALSQTEKLRPHYFWPLMMYNYRRHGENGVIKTLQYMQSMETSCDSETIKQYLIPKLQLTLQDPLVALKQLDEVGVKTSLVMTPIVNHMLAHQRMDEVIDITSKYPTKLDLPQLQQSLTNLSVNVKANKRFHRFSKLIAALANKSDQAKFDFVGLLLQNMLNQSKRLREDTYSMQRFVQELYKCGLNISNASKNALLNFLPQDVDNEKIKSIKEILEKMSTRDLHVADSLSGSNTSSFIKHPRDMSREELEYHLVELESKGLNTRGVLRRLLQLNIRDNQLSRALEIKSKCDALKVDVSAGMQASLVELYIKLKDLNKARQCIKQLEKQFPAFTLDEHKIIDLAALLVHEKQLEEAKRFLQSHAAKHRVSGGDYVLKNVWNFLTNVAQLAAELDLPADRNLTREIFTFMQSLRYCNTQNAVLGPIVRERLLRGDIKAAVKEFQQLAEMYKHTPLQFEIMSLLVRLSNRSENSLDQDNFADCTVEDAQKLLAEVTSTVASVHGDLNMNSSLLLAFAESGSDAQLRRLLMNPQYRINQELLMKNCEHLGDTGSIVTLMRLARCSRGLHNVIDEQTIYDLLMNKFMKENNHEAALDMFERLEADDDLKMSQEFLRNLVKLIKINNIALPSNLALRAQIICNV